jgi:hypothetical protein
MKRSTLAIGILAAMLAGSNAWWAYESIECGIGLAYTSDSLWNADNSLTQALAILPSVASGDRKEDVLRRASKAVDGAIPRETNDGRTIVGGLLLTFDSEGKIVAAVAYRAPAFSKKYD